MAKSTAITERRTVVNLHSPTAVAGFANELKDFVVRQKLFSPIQGKNYVHVEGWQFAGAALGIFPVLESLDDVSNEQETKYRAAVRLVRLDDDKTVGYGIAICSNKEGKKKNFDEYAIASMAQTRATAKAFRNTLGWMMKLAGYEATPAEEMGADEGQSATAPEKKPRRASVKQIQLLANKVKWGLKTYDEDEIVNFLDRAIGKSINELLASEVDVAITKVDQALREAKVSDAIAEGSKAEPDTVITDIPENVNLDGLPY